jgi:hypothetical protein
MIFVMKFQAAAMSRADIPEDQRDDFALYVDEFQNFATDSFATIMSEARKYRLNLVLANQFMTQLTDQIREAVLGNIGTVISGRIGITDAEMLQKKFMPTFDAEDLTKLPNYQTIASVMINGVPSSAFSMSLIPPMGNSNPQLRDALKKLSAAKYGRPRAQVEKEIFARLGAGDVAKKAKLEALKQAQQDRLNASQQQNKVSTTGSGSSFLNDWLDKRKQIAAPRPSAAPGQSSAGVSSSTIIKPLDVGRSEVSTEAAKVGVLVDKADPLSKQKNGSTAGSTPKQMQAGDDKEKLHVRSGGKNPSQDEISVHLR